MTTLNIDPIASRARGAATFDTLEAELAQLGSLARTIGPGSTAVMVSTLPYHEAGAHGVDELALCLSTGARYLEAMTASGLSADEAAAKIALQTSVGRDTFLELCKLRALRVGWSKVLSAFGVKGPSRAIVHAVCSSRTMTMRDPWVNMLRVTTQVFAAVLGGADVVTPNAFDQALGAASAHGRRVARNTGLVLREESSLGKVADPAAGAYAFETLTDSLARKAWSRFREIERAGGVVEGLKSGRLQAQLAEAWKPRLEAISKRKEPILGVSEFANLDEVLPVTAPVKNGERMTGLRDAEVFESIRERASITQAGSFESLRTNGGDTWARSFESPRTNGGVLLLTLGEAQARARVGFASGFFAAGGLKTREVTTAQKAAIACVCGPDELYATHGAEAIRSLKAAGCARVLVAGRPGALEHQLREAGADGFIFIGCDAVSILSQLVESAS